MRRSPIAISASIATEPASWARELVQLVEIGEVRLDLPPARSGIAARELEQRERTSQAADRTAVTGPLGDAQQVGDLSARLLDLTSVAVDLGQDREIQPLDRLPTRLACSLDRLVAPSRSLVPRSGRHFHAGQFDQVRDNLGISALVCLGDQLSPDGARLVETVASAEQTRE